MATGGLTSKWESDFQRELENLESRYSQSSGEGSETEKDNDNVDQSTDGGGDEAQALYCVWCDKVFASIGAKLNHEASKKHKKQVEKLSSLLEQGMPDEGDEEKMEDGGRLSYCDILIL